MIERVEMDRPLSGLRIVDLVRGSLAPVTRYLADLGAQVDRIAPPAAAPDDLGDAVANLGKARHAGDPTDPALRPLMLQAHAVVADAAQALDLHALRETRPALVTMSVSDFGVGNRFSDWNATGPVLHALSGELSRSGLRGREPLLPPGDLAYQCAASQAAFTLVTSIYHALRTGVGDHLDLSALDGAVQALDPGYGISGSATMGRPAHLLSRDRPVKGIQYPILECADGFVRLCLLAKRQWRGMFRWMGEPAAFASPEFDKINVRYKSPDLLPAISAFFAGRARAELETEGQRHGVPVSAVLAFHECIASDHMRARRAFCDVRLPDGSAARVPNGVISIDGERMGPRLQTQAAPSWSTPATAEASARAFDGLKVLDLGVIVVGAEQGRLLADQGADVVKVESRAYPDGSRQSHLGYGLSVSFATGHRNKRSLGINLRDPEGRSLFLDLAAEADVILSNFKPGTLEGLGLGYDELAAVNPRIVVSESSAFGATGPWSGRMGYGPLVRAATGLTLSWRYPDDPDSFSDSVTVYPDHVAARISALAVVALLTRRLRTGRGGRAGVAQAEVMLGHFAEDVARASRGEDIGQACDWPWAVYRASGEDEWCVLTVRGQADWEALCDLIGFDEGRALCTPDARLAARARIDAAIERWLGSRTAERAMEMLQQAGVPGARMLRVADLPDFPYFAERDFYRVERHPYLQEQVLAERAHVRSLSLSEPRAGPAPLAGEQTAQVIEDWLGLPKSRIEALIVAGALEPLEPEVLNQARRAASADAA